MTAAKDPDAGFDGPFRDSYLDYAALTEQLRAWARAYPEVVRLDSLGRSAEGRELWLLTIGAEPDRTRPAVWVDGNMHASELAGSSVALAIAAAAIRLHIEPDATPAGVPKAVRDAARHALFHIMPRISPDGAEAVLKTGRYVRSVPRDMRPNRQHPRWRVQDIDGDGEAQFMRVPDPAGEYVESEAEPGLMRARTIEDTGPFYKLYPEGVIEHFDGHHVPSPDFLGDNSPDLNRNFPYAWVPEPDQQGAGPYAGSEPESRAIIEFATAHPNLFAWFNLHTFGGVYIRPRGDVPDSQMNQSDLALYRQLEAWSDAISGYPTVSGHDEFTYEPGKPLHGDLTDYAYHHRGCLAIVCELWDIFRELEIPRRKPFVETYAHTTPDELVRLARWDRTHNAGRIFRPWQPVEHPQLGPVETGGWDPRVGISNPPYERLPGICDQQAAYWLRVAALLPRVVIGEPERHPLGEGLTRLVVEVRNLGYLATYGLDSARDRAWNEPLYATFEGDGCELADEAQARQFIGHLEGWGRGRHTGEDALGIRMSRGTGDRARLTVTVRGAGTLKLRVGSCRVGWVSRAVTL